MKIPHITYLSLGTNQGNKLKTFQKTIDLISSEIGNVHKIASVYKTASWGFKGNDFYNTCIKISTYQSPKTVIKKILSIETKLGRIRKENATYSNRKIDIDILLFDDKIIFSKNLIVPHPRMLERKFVLIPLVEIARSKIHPTKKIQLHICLDNCTDTSEVILTKEKLVRSISIVEKYNYIAIEGNIGVGKTTLSKMMSNNFNAKIVLERFADNPFLPKFYKDNERFAFSLEMSFLANRYQQLSDDLAQPNLFKNGIISDYYIFKSLIFAQITLQKEEYLLYQKMFDLVYKEIKKPDLYVYLYQNTNKLLQNIKKRGREYEQNIQPDYLQKIQNGYSNFIKTQQKLKTLIIDVSTLDFANNYEGYNHIINKIKKT